MNDANVLLIDAGNSRVKWAWLRDECLQEPASAFHARNGFFTALESAWMQAGQPTRVLVSNVAGSDFASKLTTYAKNYWRLQPRFIVPGVESCGVVNAYHDPHRLGADRWAALIAARHLMPGAGCIIDCGTAITVDAISADGRHLGGLILPGLRAMQSALFNNTHDLPYTMNEPAAYLVPLAHDTVTAINSGSLYAVVAALDRIVADLSAQFEIEFKLITGGDVAYITPLLSTQYRHEPRLVLQGLAIIARATS